MLAKQQQIYHSKNIFNYVHRQIILILVNNYIFNAVIHWVAGKLPHNLVQLLFVLQTLYLSSKRPVFLYQA